MAKKALDICGKCSTPAWCWPATKSLCPMCGACRAERFFNGLYSKLGFQLIGWQREVIRSIYGTTDDETGQKSYRRAYVSVAKKNGKSFLIGGMPLYHLTMEDVEAPQAYGAAAAKDQAGLVYNAAVRLAKDNPALMSRLKILPSTKRIIQKKGIGFYQVISADGDIQDGIEPSLAIIDELHRWKTSKAHTLWDVITRGTISRDEALTMQITTAGDVYDSPICWTEYQYARQILDGSVKSDRFYASIYEADEKRLKEDPEYWKSREARVAANPSHEDNGGFLRDVEIEALCREAIEKPSEQASYKRYHLNIWGQKADRWMPMNSWLECGTPTRPIVDRDCWIGLDLSRTTDMTAAVAILPDATDGSYDVIAKFWLPADRIPDIQKKVKQPLDAWVRQGYIEATPGNVVDYGFVLNWIEMIGGLARIQEIPADPHNATQFLQMLIDQGYVVVEVRQGPLSLNGAMQHILEKTLDRKIRHGSNPVMNWHMDCVTAKPDSNNNIKPDKGSLDRDGKRIDGASALITGMTRAMLPEDKAVRFSDVMVL